MPNRSSFSTLVTLLAIVALMSPASGQAGIDLGTAARAIFADKCLECHNPDSDSSKARRDFDGAWDMSLIIEKWGDPVAYDLAPLWEVVEDGSMPPQDSDAPALTAAEGDLLLKWLEQGSPLPADGNRFVDLQMAARLLAVPKAPRADAEVVEREFGDRLRIWLGRNHAAVTHFPIALLLLAALMRLLSFGPWRERTWRAEVFCLMFGAPFAIVSAALGWLNASNSGASSDLLERHRWVGVGVAIAAMLLLLTHRFLARKRWYGLLLIALAFAVAIGGHQGGEMVFGASYLDF